MNIRIIMEIPTPSSSDAVHVGFWMDHARTPILGSNLTLKNTHAQALVAFLVVLVGYCGTQSWKFWRYLFRPLIRPHAHDSLHHREQQVILRNTETASSSLMSLFGLLYNKPQIFRFRSSMRLVQICVLAAFMLLHWLAFVGLGILTSQIITGSVVKSAGTNTCGYWIPREGNSQAETFDQTVTGEEDVISALADFSAARELRLNQTLDAENYVRNCYNRLTAGMFNCDKLITRGIVIREEMVDCPFDSAVCDTPTKQSIALDSGRIKFSQLGINWKHAAKFSIRRRTICAPLTESPFKYTDVEEAAAVKILGGDPSFMNLTNINMYSYYSSSSTGQNFTMTDIGERQGYEFESYQVLHGGDRKVSSPLVPRGDFQNADITLLHMRAPELFTLEPSSDPFFTFTKPIPMPLSVYKDRTNYAISRPLNTIACHEVAQYCSDLHCTGWLPPSNASIALLVKKELEFLTGTNTRSQAEDAGFAILLVDLALKQTNIWDAIQARGPEALLTNRALSSSLQMRMAPNQWILELRNWFSMGLARLQMSIYRTIQIPPGMDRTKAKNLFDDYPALKEACGRVKFHDRRYTTLSVAGFAVVLVATFVLTIVGCVDWWVSLCCGGTRRAVVEGWENDANLLLLRRVEGGYWPTELKNRETGPESR